MRYAYDPATGEHTRTYVLADNGTGTASTTICDDTRCRYDNLGRLQYVDVLALEGTVYATLGNDGSLTGTPLTTTYAYTATGSLARTTLPNGVTTTYTYDDLNRLTDEVIAQANSTRIQSYTFSSIPRVSGWGRASYWKSYCHVRCTSPGDALASAGWCAVGDRRGVPHGRRPEVLG